MILAAAFGIFLCGPRHAYPDAREEVHKIIIPEAGKPVEIDNINGSVTVSAWDRDVIDVLAVKKTRKNKDELDRVSIVIDNTDVLKIRTDIDSRNRHERTFLEKLLEMNWSMEPRVTVEYTVNIPQSCILGKAKTTNGAVTISGTTGDTIAETTNGAVRIEKAQGRILAKSTNGSISAFDITGQIDAVTTNGKINCENISGIINAHTTNGAIDIQDSHSIRKVHTTNSSIDIKLTGFLDCDMDVKTTNGSITLQTPREMNVYLDMSTTNGSIEAEGFTITISQLSKNHLTGTIGTPERSVTLRTTNGSIRLKPNG